VSKKSESEQSPWRQLVVDAIAWAAEPIEGALIEEGALGTERVDDTTRAMPGRPAMPTGKVTIIAPFSREPGLEARVTAAVGRVIGFLEESLGDAQLEIAWSDLWPEDYQAAFKASWKPIQLSDRVFIIPTWDEDFELPSGAIGLRLDPGLAFGTGSHPTTRLCALRVQERVAEGPVSKLLDVGTGTGILSLIAMKLGVPVAVGTDIDPAALSAARDNAIQNGITSGFTLHGELPDRDGPVYDVVIANILASPLLTLAAPIARAMAPGGQLMLSGILEEQADSIERAYVAEGLKATGRVVDEGWVRLDLVRPA
jgi:ribosomal protein L11 methyltransferase